MLPKWTFRMYHLGVFPSNQCGWRAAALFPFQAGLEAFNQLRFSKNIVNVTFEINLNIKVFLPTNKQIL